MIKKEKDRRFSVLSLRAAVRLIFFEKQYKRFFLFAFHHPDQLTSGFLHESRNVWQHFVREAGVEAVRLECQITFVSYLAKQSHNQPEVVAGGEGKRVQIAVAVCVVHVKRLKALFSEPADHDLHVLAAQRDVADVKARDDPFAVKHVDVFAEFLDARAGAVHDRLSADRIHLPHVLDCDLDAELLAVRYQALVKIKVYLFQHILVLTVRQMLFRVHDYALRTENRRDLHRAYYALVNLPVVCRISGA